MEPQPVWRWGSWVGEKTAEEGLEEGGQSSALKEAAWTMLELLPESLGFLVMLKPRRKVGR